MGNLCCCHDNESKKNNEFIIDDNDKTQLRKMAKNDEKPEDGDDELTQIRKIDFQKNTDEDEETKLKDMLKTYKKANDKQDDDKERTELRGKFFKDYSLKKKINEEDENEEDEKDDFDSIPMLSNFQQNESESETFFSQRNTINPMTRHLKLSKPIEEIFREYEVKPYDKKAYKGLKVLGKGAFSRVILAYNEELKFLAIKEITLKKPKHFRALLYEVEILKAIQRTNNPNFLKFHGFFKKNEMEYVILMARGEVDLLTVLKYRRSKGKPYKENEIAHILHFISKQYAFLEEKRIAHSDVKPANVMISKLSELSSEYIYCIYDFGISFRLEKNEKLIPCKDILGFTKPFAAPEILRIEEDKYPCSEYDPFLSDVYSLGVLTLQLRNESKKNFLETHKNQNKNQVKL